MPIFGLLGSLIKKKPSVPTFNPLNVGDEAGKAISANKANFGAASELASEVDSFNQEQLMARMKQIIPDLDSINAGVSGNIASMVSGQIPEDVAAQVARSGAAKAFAGGFGGSQRAGGLVARDLGLTSLQITKQGLDSASKWLATAKSTMSAPQLDVTSMFISPQQQISAAFENEKARMNNQFLKNQVDSEFSVGNRLAAGLSGFDAPLGAAAGTFLGNWASNRWS